MKEQKKPYTLTLRPSLVEEIDKKAKKLGISRSQMVENLAEIALDDVGLLEKAGFIDLALAGRNLVAKFKEKIFKGEIALDNDGEVKLKK